MADNFLITGYHGAPHVTAENDRGINAGICGAGRYVLDVGNKFRAEYIGNNTVRMYDGKLIDNGAAAGIAAGEYIDFLIPTAGQGKSRYDLIVFEYRRDSSTLIESGTFIVLQGEETSGTPTIPTLKQSNLLTNKANLDQMELWKLHITGTTIEVSEQLFTAQRPMKDINSILNNIEKKYDTGGYSLIEKLPSGTIVRFGTVFLNSTSEATHYISNTDSINIDFDDNYNYGSGSLYSIILTPNKECNVWFTDPTKDGFAIKTNATTAVQVKWLAIGW